MLTSRKISLPSPAIALLGVMLLWMNFAFIQHQYDLAPSHHQEHHCELFSSVHHAISSTALKTENVSLPDRFERQPSYQYQAPSIVVYRARSPPTQSLV
ncbi:MULTISPECIES: DUF2607 family protein [Vibrio]|uniref:DUF2607 family protein n=1 Tax=Vibrio TaxID=662 RepID=UPI001E32E901|nr:DUF2607 family protein [Vibrio sinaloensis]